MCFLQHRIADKRVLGLIARWLRVGVLENGQRIPAKQGTPQGEMIVVRYADDSVLGFERLGEALVFQDVLAARLTQFNLALHPEKTRLLRFGWYAAEDRRNYGLGKPETFDFSDSRISVVDPRAARSS